MVRWWMKPLCWTRGHPLTLVERTSPQTQHMRCTQCGSHYGRHSDLNGWGAYLLPWESVREFYELEEMDLHRLAELHARLSRPTSAEGE